MTAPSWNVRNALWMDRQIATEYQYQSNVVLPFPIPAASLGRGGGTAGTLAIVGGAAGYNQFTGGAGTIFTSSVVTSHDALGSRLVTNPMCFEMTVVALGGTGSQIYLSSGVYYTQAGVLHSTHSLAAPAWAVGDKIGFIIWSNYSSLNVGFGFAWFRNGVLLDEGTPVGFGVPDANPSFQITTPGIITVEYDVARMSPYYLSTYVNYQPPTTVGGRATAVPLPFTWSGI